MSTRSVGYFEQLLSERILVLDGAMGTMIQRFSPTETDYRGERFAKHPIDLKNAGDVLVLTQPKMIADIPGNISRPVPTSSKQTRSTPISFA